MKRSLADMSDEELEGLLQQHDLAAQGYEQVGEVDFGPEPATVPAAPPARDPRPAPLMRPDTGGSRGDPDAGGPVTNPSLLDRLIVGPGGNAERLASMRAARDLRRGQRDIPELFAERHSGVAQIGGDSAPRLPSEDQTGPERGNPALGMLAFPVSGIAGGVARSLPGVAQALQSGSRLARGAGGVVGGAASGAAGSAVTGGDKNDILLSTLVGAGLGAAGDVAGAIRSPRSRTGQALEAIGAVGGRPALPRPAKGGMFDEPGYRALPPGGTGTADMARGARNRIAENMEARKTAQEGALNAVEDEVARDLGRRPIDTTSEVAKIGRLREARMGGDGPTLPQADDALANVERQLTGAKTRASMTPSLIKRGGKNVNTFSELRNLQKAENEAAKAGKTSGDLASGARKQAAGVVRGAVRKADKRMPPALDAYGAEEQNLSRLDDLIFGVDEAVPPTGAAKGDAATNRLARAGGTGGDDRVQRVIDQRLDEAMGLDPVVAREVPRLRARNAAEGTLSFGVPELSTGPLRFMLRLLGKNADAASVKALPLLDAAGEAAIPGALSIDPLLEMMRERRAARRKEKRP